MGNGDDENRLYQILTNEDFTPEFIAGATGDQLQAEEEKELLELLIKESGDDFYANLLFFITHEIFDERKAVRL
jgi:hypothetical protein